ncbi:hypothetical protein JCM3765_002354 [Sporobolomyces pararoseus]
MLTRSTKFFSPTFRNFAKLVSSSSSISGPLNSISPELAKTLPPPAAPLDPTITTTTATRRRSSSPIPLTTDLVSCDKTQESTEYKEEELEQDDDDDIRLEELFLTTLNRIVELDHPSITTTLPKLIESSRKNSGKVLKGFNLIHESNPTSERRVRTTDGTSKETTRHVDDDLQDGIVLVAHVVGGSEKPKVFISSGFAIQAQEEEESKDQMKGSIILTCLHTLNQVESYLKTLHSTSPPPPSTSFVLTCSGHIFPIESLLSSLPSSDLLLLRLSQNPIDSSYTNSQSSTSSSSSPPPRLRSLPINPYPSPPSTLISTYSYLNPLSKLYSTSPSKLNNWQSGKIIEYKDSIGRTISEVGSYDELNSFYMSNSPIKGSSGGPIIEIESGSVIGITRGSTHKYGDRTRYGFATPSERILDFFELPNLKT